MMKEQISLFPQLCLDLSYKENKEVMLRKVRELIEELFFLLTCRETILTSFEFVQINVKTLGNIFKLDQVEEYSLKYAQVKSNSVANYYLGIGEQILWLKKQNLLVDPHDTMNCLAGGMIDTAKILKGEKMERQNFGFIQEKLRTLDALIEPTKKCLESSLIVFRKEKGNEICREEEGEKKGVEEVKPKEESRVDVIEGVGVDLEKISPKGLTNKAGENNCFLNVVIQALWHMKHFHSLFEETCNSPQFRCHPPSCLCVHCALSEVFMLYKWSDEESIPPNALRSSLHKLYEAEAKFQFNDIADAGEALEAILDSLHQEHLSNLKKTECEGQCLSHTAFGVQEISVINCENCKFSDLSEISFKYFTYISANGIIDQFNNRNSFQKAISNLSKPIGKTCETV